MLMLDSLADSQTPQCAVNGLPGAQSKVGGIARFQLGAPEIVSLGIYAGLLAGAIPHHEQWADEAQAWQIARTLPLVQIFHALAYEAHPPLVYICLWGLP